MRPTLPALFALMLAMPTLADDPPPTPGPQDIPRAVPGDIGLAGAARPDISRYLNVRTASAPSFSADGERFAFASDITGQRQVWVVDRRGGWPRQLTFGEDGARFHEWSPRGDWIVYGADLGGNEREGFYLISPDGTKERELVPASPAFRVFGGFSPDGKTIAYATTAEGSAVFAIHLVDVDSGQDRQVFAGRLGLFVAAWHPHGSHLLLTERRGEGAADLHLLRLVDGHFETLRRPDEPATYDSFAWLADGSGFYLATNEGREFSALAFYDFAARSLRFVETPDHDVESVALDAAGRRLLWTTNEGGWSVLHGRDLESSTALSPPPLPRGTYDLAASRLAPVVAATASGPRLPGDIWTWRVGDKETVRATQSALAGLDAEAFVVPDHRDFPARDGVMLHGLLYLPTSTRGGAKPPVLLAVHGGPTAQARPRFSAVHQYLLSRGIAIFDLNFRGSTGYGKTFSHLDDRRERPKAVLDMADALDYLARDGHVDATRAAVMGGSYGGFMAFAGLTMLPDRFAAGVSLIGVSNWVSALEGASPQLKASDRFEYGDIDDPEDRAFFLEISPITYVDRVRAPLMVVHGANDPRDPVTESDQFVRAIRARGGTVEYLRFPDEGHGVRKLPNRIITYRRVAAFLERELAVAPP